MAETRSTGGERRSLPRSIIPAMPHMKWTSLRSEDSASRLTGPDEPFHLPPQDDPHEPGGHPLAEAGPPGEPADRLLPGPRLQGRHDPVGHDLRRRRPAEV